MLVCSRLARWFFTFVIAIAWSAGPARAQFDELASKVPSTANAIMFMNVEKVMDSPMAKAEGWREKYEEAFASGMVSIPPHTLRMVTAAQLDFEMWQPAWRTILFDMDVNISIPSIARQLKGTPDTVNGLPSVILRQDAYIVEFGKRQLGAMSPANRQEVARWIRQGEGRSSPALSSYLDAALKRTSTSDIIQAFDMQDAIPVDVIEAKLKVSNAVSSAKGDIKALTDVLSTVKGFMLEIIIRDAPVGRLVFDFGKDAAPLAQVGKPLLLEILAETGMRIESIDDWQGRVEGTRFVLQGDLSKVGLRKVFSLIDEPVASFRPNDDDVKKATPDSGSQVAYATKQYFRSIQSIIKDIKNDVKNSVTLGQVGVWFDKWAGKIDRLPMLDVDPDMLDYGNFCAGSLRAMAASMQGIGINSASRSAQIYNSGNATINTTYGGGYYGRYAYSSGYYEWRNVDAERRAVRAEEKAKGAIDARAQAREINNASAKIRRMMTEKYKMEF